MVGSSAFCPRSADLAPTEGNTGLGSVFAPLPLPAVLVPQAANFNAADQGIALQTTGTEAVGNMLLHLALCPLPARNAAARVSTLLGYAGFGEGTVIIRDALDCKKQGGQTFLHRNCHQWYLHW